MTNTEVEDWHKILGHPSDSYLKHLFKEGKIKGEFKPSRDCQICQKPKIQNRPHNRALPSSTTAFHCLHTDTVEITPAAEQGIKYVLVIVDDYSRYNCVYLMTNKSQAQGFIMAFVNEIHKKGISLERGPADSPQTNGVAKRFNQTLLTKIFCLLAQSKIPIRMWNEAANHSSLLLNLHPHKSIGMISPYEVLSLKNMFLEAPIKLERLVPFGLKTTLHVWKTSSKLALRGETLRALTFEKHSENHVSATPAISPVDNIKCSNQKAIDNTSEATQSNTKSNYTYVPYYDQAPRDISHQIDSRNIIEGSRRKSNIPDRVLLTDLVTYSMAMNDPMESKHWEEGMNLEFDAMSSFYKYYNCSV
ncbi:hypothetical protein O181_019448 [Austropuccinia psidii MF-1]|uniref:Integrase catalytic domain-containing protein n=1 Tax=Austropuccinia psidii MF-1 TaxID=1389203 RepID=A0A9Q3C9N6_9BASI|nr:hypothetical protein [Austropuccinia psidii MF-1]